MRQMSAGLLCLLVVAAGLYLLVRWHTRNFKYRCGECGREFTISAGRNFVSPHWPTRCGGRKYLKCSQCGRKTWAAVIPRARNG